ncbi:FAD/FMN-containing dehydrogenase [Trinickia symbiotica]|nr:FAD-binding and (Fe-S)-binding domain-containing protein [Trinickia symbiotica]PPK46816.1 FAD/FMN-containing dehydrogenase [Trinickia symbiotica]
MSVIDMHAHARTRGQRHVGDARRQNDAARELAAALRGKIAGEVRFDGGSRALYATDHSIYRQVPIGVVIPQTDDDVIAVVAACRERGVPVLGRGCGTSLAGQTCNVAVVIDFSKYMNRLVALDPESRQARVEPGLINDQLRDAAQRHGLTFAPDPATHRYCTLGGNIGNNSCGAHTVMGGKTVDNVLELDVLTYDGLRMRVGETSDDAFELIVREGGRRAQIYRDLKALIGRYGDAVRRSYPQIPRRVSGYNLDDLLPEKHFHVARSLVGSESTCALVLGATVRLIDYPAFRTLMVLSYPNAAAAADEVVRIREFGPVAIEGFHQHMIDNMLRKGKRLPGVDMLDSDGAYLLVEFGGMSAEEAKGKVENTFAALRNMNTGASAMHLFEDPHEQEEIWALREGGVGASRVPEDEEAWPSWEDAAVPPERLGDYLRDFDALNRRYHYRYTLYGHFGDGCVHTRMTFGLRTTEGVRKFRAYMEEAADLCVSYGGSLSGEHGDGQARGELLPKMFGAEVIQAFRDFKTIWDPTWRMNPGKIIDPYPLDTNLRTGPDYKPIDVVTHFHFPEDRHSFADATERCFGVGKCRELGGEMMCPSFQATREEKYSTRGRARLLFEMMRGEAIKDGWRSDAVRDALDLCLQCKGCKHDCPVSVDMATYKAEFLSHHYAGRLRPRAAYSMGLIDVWSRVAMLAPGWVNALLRSPGIGALLKAATGFTSQRETPAYAAETFKQWWREREREHVRSGDPTLPEVILWPDTFNNFFLPGTAKAAVRVLEAAGYRVAVPDAPLCCGRPLYDYGFLDLAKRRLHRILDELRPAIRAGIPMVVLEPSCASVFRDEMPNLLATDRDAERLARQTLTLSELLAQTDGWSPPRLEARALLQSHCHQRAVLNADAQRELLVSMGIELQPLRSGCCGHAGSFGYEREHYDVSQTIAEQVLLPAVRKAAPDTLVIADGFSCRQQIRDGTGRWPMHPAEAVALALERQADRSIELAERHYLEPAARVKPEQAAIAAAAVLALGVLGALALRRYRTS